jgi:methionine-gamma-lyase
MDRRTICAQGNRVLDEDAEKVMTPTIVPASTFEFESQSAIDDHFATGKGYVYSRYDNPTVNTTEGFLARLEGGEATAMFASGMAAISTTCVTLAGSSRRIAAQEGLYGGTTTLFAQLMSRVGIDVRWIPRDRISTFTPADLDGCGLLYLETPVNPVLRLVDLERAAGIAREAGVPTVVDGTFAPPVVQHPLSHGIDLVLHSATKYLGGHNDLIGGAVTGSADRIAELAEARKSWGGIMDPFTAFLLHRGLRTLAVRMEAHCRGALQVAEALDGMSAVDEVYYPGLPGHPDHELAGRQMNGGGGMVSFTVAGGPEAAVRVHDRLELFARAGSLGGTESLVSIPSRMSHRHLDDQGLAREGIPRGLIRLSVGLESADDLVADLKNAIR